MLPHDYFIPSPISWNPQQLPVNLSADEPTSYFTDKTKPQTPTTTSIQLPASMSTHSHYRYPTSKCSIRTNPSTCAPDPKPSHPLKVYYSNAPLFVLDCQFYPSTKLVLLAYKPVGIPSILKKKSILTVLPLYLALPSDIYTAFNSLPSSI